MTEDNNSANNNIKIPVKRTGTKIVTKSPVMRVKSPGRQITCSRCKSTISPNNQYLTCKICGKHFCTTCEKKIQKQFTYEDKDEEHKLEQTYPLCESCYKININNQIERITMDRRFEQLNRSLPSEPEIWLSTGQRFISSNMFLLAAMCFSESIKMDEGYKIKVIETWKETAKKLITESRLVEAIQCFDEALKMDDRSESIWLLKGINLIKLSRDKEALDSFNKILEINDRSVEALAYKGYLSAKNKNMDGFNKSFDHAKTLAPDHELVWLMKSKGHLVLNQNQELLESSERAITINSENPESQIYKCKGLINLKNYEKALHVSEKILSLEPQNPEGLFLKGIALLGLGNNTDAIEKFEQVIKIDPNGDIVDINRIQEGLYLAETSVKGVPIKTIEKQEDLLKVKDEEKPLTPEQQHLMEENRRRKEEEEKRRLADQEWMRQEYERERKGEEERRKREDEERKKREEEERRKREDEERKKREEEERRKREDEAPVKETKKLEQTPNLEELLGILNQLENSDTKVGSEEKQVKSFIKDQSKMIKTELIELQSSGIVITKLVKLYKEAGKRFKKEDYMTALKIIIEIVEEKEKREKEQLNQEIEGITDKIAQLKTDYPIDKLNARFDEIKKNIDRKNTKENLNEINELKKQIVLTEKYYPKAKKLIDNLEQKIENIGKTGLNVDTPKRILKDMKSFFASNDYEKLPELKKVCLKAMEESRSIYAGLLKDIKVAQERLEVLKRKGLESNECKKLLKRAKMMIISGDYPKAREFIDKCVELYDGMLNK